MHPQAQNRTQVPAYPRIRTNHVTFSYSNI
jgi:hypothetical protein